MRIDLAQPVEIDARLDIMLPAGDLARFATVDIGEWRWWPM